MNPKKMSNTVYEYDPTSEFMHDPDTPTANTGEDTDDDSVDFEEDNRIRGIAPGSRDAFRVAKERTDLLCKLLDGVCDSVLTFKPSKSLSNLKAHQSEEGLYLDENEELIENRNTKSASSDSLMNQMEEEKDVEIDIVLSGGGLKGYFVNGAAYVLMKELKKRKIKIARVSGASAGSWAGAFMLTNFGAGNWLETYFACQVRPGSTLLGT